MAKVKGWVIHIMLVLLFSSGQLWQGGTTDHDAAQSRLQDCKDWQTVHSVVNTLCLIVVYIHSHDLFMHSAIKLSIKALWMFCSPSDRVAFASTFLWYTTTLQIMILVNIGADFMHSRLNHVGTLYAWANYSQTFTYYHILF